MLNLQRSQKHQLKRQHQSQKQSQQQLKPKTRFTRQIYNDSNKLIFKLFFIIFLKENLILFSNFTFTTLHQWTLSNQHQENPAKIYCVELSKEKLMKICQTFFDL